MPNALTWGYYPTIWRRWPGEDHLSEINPRAIHGEIIPTTPEGFKTPVLKLKPKAAEVPEVERRAENSGPQATPSLQPSPSGRDAECAAAAARTATPNVLPQPGGPTAPEATPGNRPPSGGAEGVPPAPPAQRP